MSGKREIFARLADMFASLDRANKNHAACISDFQNVVNDFIKSDFIKYQSPKHTEDCVNEDSIPPVEPVTSNLPPELSGVILLLQAELKKQHKALVASQGLMEVFFNQFHIALNNCENCASCRNLFARNFLRPVEDKGILKFICNDCFEDEYFDCHKCKRILPNSEQGEEDSELGYGWICKDCIKPMGFPQEVVIAPDFEGCEDVAAADINALCKYALNATGWREPNLSDTIDLEFVKFKDGHLRHYAIYRSESGLKCEIGELDWRGIGSLYIYEEQASESNEDEE